MTKEELIAKPVGTILYGEQHNNSMLWIVINEDEATALDCTAKEWPIGKTHPLQLLTAAWYTDVTNDFKAPQKTASNNHECHCPSPSCHESDCAFMAHQRDTKWWHQR